MYFGSVPVWEFDGDGNEAKNASASPPYVAMPSASDVGSSLTGATGDRPAAEEGASPTGASVSLAGASSFGTVAPKTEEEQKAKDKT